MEPVAATHRLHSSNRSSAVLQRNLPGREFLYGHQPQSTPTLPDQAQHSSDWPPSAPSSLLREPQDLFTPAAEWLPQTASTSSGFGRSFTAHNVSPADLIFLDSTYGFDLCPYDKKLPSIDDCNTYSQISSPKAPLTLHDQSGDCSTTGTPLGRLCF